MSAPASGFHLKPLHKVSVNLYGFYFNCLSPVLWDAKHQLWTCTTETHAMTIKTNSPAYESLREQQSVGCQYSTCWGQPRDFPTPPPEVGSSLASKPHSSWLLVGSDSILAREQQSKMAKLVLMESSTPGIPSLTIFTSTVLCLTLKLLFHFCLCTTL